MNDIPKIALLANVDQCGLLLFWEISEALVDVLQLNEEDDIPNGKVLSYLTSPEPPDSIKEFKESVIETLNECFFDDRENITPESILLQFREAEEKTGYLVVNALANLLGCYFDPDKLSQSLKYSVDLFEFTDFRFNFFEILLIGEFLDDTNKTRAGSSRG